MAFLSYAKRFDPILPIIESSFNIVLIRDLASYLQMLRYLLSFPTSVKTSDSARQAEIGVVDTVIFFSRTKLLSLLKQLPIVIFKPIVVGLITKAAVSKGLTVLCGKKMTVSTTTFLRLSLVESLVFTLVGKLKR